MINRFASDSKLYVTKKSSYELLDLNDLIRSSIKFIEHMESLERISLQKKLTPKLPEVRANAGDISLVIVNLLTNSLDSMPDGGKLLIKSQFCKEHESCVQLSISDTGCGIKEDEMDKIYSPFFTTKDKLKGMGLGLAISKRIIEDHDGKIKVVSSLGEGATFIVCFPAADKGLPNN
ncbi:MAG: sensor histidine kinase [Candidatus Scalinduaceae bacterium]